MRKINGLSSQAAFVSSQYTQTLSTIWRRRILLICDEVASSVQSFSHEETSKAESNGRMTFDCREGRAKNGETKPWRLIESRSWPSRLSRTCLN